MPMPLPAETRTFPCRRAGRALRLGLAAALLLSAAMAQAQSAITVYGGVRGGGSFENADNNDAKIDLDSGPAFSASVDWRLADGRQGQVFYSFQRSALPGSTFGQPGDVDVNISYLHLGGRAFFDGGVAGSGGYVVGGLGATWFSPGLSGLSDEIRPSMNIGVGYQWPLAPNIALRTELRTYLTLINSNGGFFCSGGCVVSIRGDGMAQFEGMVGLSFGF
jgi:hypothetical protein